MYKDLHLHLSGATNPVILYEIIKESGYKFKAKDYWDFEKQVLFDRKNVTDLSSYLDILHTIDKAQSSPMAIKRSVYNAFVSSYMSGANYLELRMNPTKRSQEGSIDLDSIIVAARAGMEKAKSNFGIDGNLVLCLGRDVTPEANLAIFNKAKKYFGKGVIGIDLAGPYFEPHKFMDKGAFMDYLIRKHSDHDMVEIYSEANQLGMTTTVHCGEVPHAAVEEEIAYVLNILQPKRIGHGIQIYKFPQLMKFARKKNIHFEVCISSNLTTGVVKSEDEYAKILATLNLYNIDYSINTDSTFLLSTNILKENLLHSKLLASESFRDKYTETLFEVIT